MTTSGMPSGHAYPSAIVEGAHDARLRILLGEAPDWNPLAYHRQIERPIDAPARPLSGPAAAPALALDCLAHMTGRCRRRHPATGLRQAASQKVRPYRPARRAPAHSPERPLVSSPR